MRDAARIFAESDKIAVLFGSSLIQSSVSGQGFVSLWNLALLMNTQLFPLGMESNQRGILAMTKNRTQGLLSFSKILQDVPSGELKALYIVGPMPYVGKKKPEFLVVQDSYLSETAELADVILPAATFLETEGVFVNTEGRLQKFDKVTGPQGESRPDWWIVSQVGQKMRRTDFSYKNSSAIWKDISRSIPGFARISRASLNKGEDAFLREGRKGEKRFLAPKIKPEVEQTSKKYPYLLWCEHNLDYYRNMNLSQDNRGFGRIRNSRWIMISPEDAETLNLKEEEEVVLESSKGKCRRLVKISSAVSKGNLKARYLYKDDADYSLIRLFASLTEEPRFGRPIPVKVIRG